MACEHGYERGPSYCPFCRRAQGVTPPQPVTGKERKEKGMAEAAAGADRRWYAEALVCVRNLAAVRHEVTADDVMEMLENMGLTTDEPRAMGAVMRNAAEVGWITGQPEHYRPSRRAARNNGPVRVWYSLLKETQVSA